jgi:hypothetical protein
VLDEERYRFTRPATASRWPARHDTQTRSIPIAFPCSSHGDPRLWCYGESKGWNAAAVSSLEATCVGGGGRQRCAVPDAPRCIVVTLKARGWGRATDDGSPWSCWRERHFWLTAGWHRTHDVLCWGAPTSWVKVDERGLAMQCVCMACGGSGLAQHVDRTLPPPPCRVCRPEEAALHMALAHETRTVAAARRRDAYQRLRAAIAPGDIFPLPGRADGVTRRGRGEPPATWEEDQAHGRCVFSG